MRVQKERRPKRQIKTYQDGELHSQISWSHQAQHRLLLPLCRNTVAPGENNKKSHHNSSHFYYLWLSPLYAKENHLILIIFNLPDLSTQFSQKYFNGYALWLGLTPCKTTLKWSTQQKTALRCLRALLITFIYNGLILNFDHICVTNIHYSSQQEIKVVIWPHTQTKAQPKWLYYYHNTQPYNVHHVMSLMCTHSLHLQTWTRCTSLHTCTQHPHFLPPTARVWSDLSAWPCHSLGVYASVDWLCLCRVCGPCVPCRSCSWHPYPESPFSAAPWMLPEGSLEWLAGRLRCSANELQATPKTRIDWEPVFCPVLFLKPPSRQCDVISL